jgi:hypothetical protein
MSLDQLGMLSDKYERERVSDWQRENGYDPDRLLMFVVGLLCGGVIGWLCGVWV